MAGSLLQNYFDDYSQHFNIPHSVELLGVFGQENVRKLVREADLIIDSNLETEVIQMEMKIQETVFNEEAERTLVFLWNIPHNVFKLTVPLLKYPAYCRYIMKGLCTSTGGIS